MHEQPSNSRRWRRSLVYGLGTAGVAASAAACVPADLPLVDGERAAATTTVTQAIRDGDTEREATYVVAVLNGGGLCSGSLIAPNLVLTAQHCVADIPSAPAGGGVDCEDFFGPVGAADDFAISTGTRAYDGERLVRVAEVRVPKTDPVCDNDVAVLILQRNLEPAEAVPIVPRVDADVEVDEPYSAYGYGAPRAGTRRVVHGKVVLCAGLFCGAPENVGRGEWVGDGNVCSGDSGGPAIDARGRVIGVASRGDDECTAATYAGLIEWADWLREAGADAAELGGYAPARWVTEGLTDAVDDADWDGVLDADDNCVDEANAAQDDVDGDGRGDACDPTNDALRGGDCAVCDGCSAGVPCGDGLSCQATDAGSLCTQPCDADEACPMNTVCRNLSADGLRGFYCVNDTYDRRGLCDGAWLCLDRAPATEDTGADVSRDTGSAGDATDENDTDAGPPDDTTAAGETGTTDEGAAPDDGASADASGDAGVGFVTQPGHGCATALSSSAGRPAPWGVLALLALIVRRRNR